MSGHADDVKSAEVLSRTEISAVPGQAETATLEIASFLESFDAVTAAGVQGEGPDG
jgi:hypothetical protein